MTPDEIRFAADGMLQSLATWLRLLGYDCLAGKELFGRQLLEQAAAENRVFLTRNSHLADNLPHQLLERCQIAIVASERLPDQLREVVTRFSLHTDEYVFTRCTECNVPLRRVDRAEALGQVPPHVAESETGFWRCPQCGKTFWRGSHVRDSLQRLERWLADGNEPPHARFGL
jgi:uncharacterized protein with PIN domain